ncbi:MAG: DNA alkylation repair protein [Candidatus Dormiibacterota bacterium]
MDVAATVRDIETATRACGTSARAAGERQYLKSDLEHLGATVSDIRRVARGTAAAHPDIAHDELMDLVGSLWSRPVHESRMAAVMLLELFPKLLRLDDLDTVELMIRGSRTWAYVDALAGHVAGGLVTRFPESSAWLDRWAVDVNFWIRRSALLALLDSVKRGERFDQFGGYADSMLAEKEFFIRKAIGRVLRETGKKHPDEVYGWVLPRASRASGVTLREAVRYLSPAQRSAILEASGRQSR